jgi:hypothetical protein
MATEEILFPLKHPDEIFKNVKLDEIIFKKFEDDSLFRRILRRIYFIIYGL